MGEFITRGMALGFLAGASTALIARRHAVLKKHPNLLGFAVAGTVDALSRDYRRPVVYDKLMKLDSPLSSKAKSILYSIRTGLPEEPPTLVNIPKEALYKPEGKVIETESPKPAHSEQQPDEHGWWDAPSSEHVTSDSDAKDGAPELNQFGYPIQLPPGGPLNGTKTWADIRRESQSKRD
jgi:hypothetical protein